MTTKQLPKNPNLDHLKDQAKSLLKGYRSFKTEALDRFLTHLPAANGKSHEQVAAMQLKLHDAQSVIAREYGFSSWANLVREVTRLRTAQRSPMELRELYKLYVFGKGFVTQKPNLAKHLLEDVPTLLEDPYFALTAGIVREEMLAPEKVNLASEGIPPLVWVTHSSLIRLDEFAGPIRSASRQLIQAGADVHGYRIDDQFPESPLTALYGAAGQNHDIELTKILLEAGADPNDNESMYHATESRNKEILRLLVAHGAVWKGTNALLRHLDFDDVDGLREAIQLGAVPNGYPGECPPIFHAVLRGRSTPHIKVLLDAGADANANHHGVSVYRMAKLVGNSETTRLLAERGADKTLPLKEEFIGFCAAGNEEKAREMLDAYPNMITDLSPHYLALLPLNAAHENIKGCKLMLELGWPVNSQGLEWRASGLDQAIYSGSLPLVELFLDHGANVYQVHGYNNDSWGTLSFVTNQSEELSESHKSIADAMLKVGPPRATNISASLEQYLAGKD